MPKIIDHDVRRREIATCAMAAIAEHGLDGVRMEHVAHMAGCTTGAIVHFYPNKDGILDAALDASRDMMMESYDRDREGSLTDVLSSILPLDGDRMVMWKAWVAYSGSQRSQSAAFKRRTRVIYRKACDWAEEVLQEAKLRGEIASRCRPEMVAPLVVAVLDGIGLRATIDAGFARKANQVQQIEEFVRTLQ